jgi:hypothetical protein
MEEKTISMVQLHGPWYKPTLNNLPDLSKLHNLRTLDLEGCPYLERLPNGVGNS